MEIAIDGSQLGEDYTGVGRYLYNILKYLAPLNRDIKYKIFISSQKPANLSGPNIKFIHVPQRKRYFIWQNHSLLKSLKNESYDIFWSPNYYLPLFLKKDSIISLHDISWNHLKEDYSFINRTRRNMFMKSSLKKAIKIFTISDFSKNEIIDHYGADSSDVISIPLGVDDSFRTSSTKDIEVFKKKYGISSEKTVGFLGSVFKRRNVDKLILSFQNIKKLIPDAGLVIVGNIFDMNVNKLLRDNPGVVYIKRLKEGELNPFYSSLSLFAYLSEYEGFGFPPLEALKCGTVPLLLKKTSLKEIYTDIALFIEEADPAIITETISEFLTSPGTSARGILESFRKREEFFSWKRVAGEYLSELNNIENILGKRSSNI